jgi:hypothetical protein
LLLGDRLKSTETEIRRDAEEATRKFLALYGTSKTSNAT